MADLIKAITEADKELRMSDKNPMWEAHDVKMDDKATDDIRDGIARGLAHTDTIQWEGLGEAHGQYHLIEANRIINYLKSKNVVRLVDNQELPKWKMAKERDEFGNAVYRLAQQDTIDAGWRKCRNLDGTEL